MPHPSVPTSSAPDTSTRRKFTDIARDEPPYIIAEIGVNHDGSVERALELVDAAHHAGADAIKLQLFETDRLMSKASRLASYQAGAGEADPFSMLRRLELSIEEMHLIVERAHAHGLHAIVTVFSVELVPVAEQLPWDAYKSASPDIINRPLLEAMAGTGKPLIVSTGASTLEEVVRAVDWLLPVCADRLGLLQCVSSYPTPREHSALRAIEVFTHEFPTCTIGYSDHTPEIDTGGIATILGARVLEKHLTYDRCAKGPDHAASLNPEQFASYVRTTTELMQTAEQGSQPGENDDERLGRRVKTILECEHDVRAVSRQSLVATRDLPAGHVITRDDLTIKRPGTGIEPWRINEIIGSRTTQPVSSDMPILPADISL
ncbi:MAG: N-acetylneuraminate synthase family protein [Phycisphaeraceae bacterium]|nr:N-acetylneuraminate synthase family protein [Phycisphaerales bacterium]MCB9860245.1 N-acetylneuraminate synthase family protein [Phycisphaeraceae bacterium]